MKNFQLPIHNCLPRQCVSAQYCKLAIENLLFVIDLTVLGTGTSAGWAHGLSMGAEPPRVIFGHAATGVEHPFVRLLAGKNVAL
jgi:hypothetical protein